MFCRNCGEELGDNAACCSKCGYVVGGGNDYCPTCGVTVKKRQAMCTECKTMLIEHESDDLITPSDYMAHKPEVKRIVLYSLALNITAIAIACLLIFAPMFIARFTNDSTQIETVRFSYLDDIMQYVNQHAKGIMHNGIINNTEVFLIFSLIALGTVLLLLLVSLYRTYKSILNLIFINNTTLYRYWELLKFGNEKNIVIFPIASIITTCIFASCSFMAVDLIFCMLLESELNGERMLAYFSGITIYGIILIILIAINIFIKITSKRKIALLTQKIKNTYKQFRY